MERRKKWTGWKPRNDEAKIEVQNAAMRREEEKQEENLGTIRKEIRVAAAKTAHSTKNKRDKAVKQTPENVRVRDEEAARCTDVIKTRVLRKQARKARADHLVKCSLIPGMIWEMFPNLTCLTTFA